MELQEKGGLEGGGSESPWPLGAGGRWWLQYLSHGQVSTEKACKAYCKTSMRWREGMGKSLGKNAGGRGLGEQLILSGTKNLSVLTYVLWGMQDRGWEGEQKRRSWFLPHLPHTYSSFFPHLEENTPGLSLTLPTLSCFPFNPLFFLLPLPAALPLRVSIPSLPLCLHLPFF